MFHLFKSKNQLALCLSLLLATVSTPTLLAGDCLNSVWPVVYDSEAPLQSLYNWGEFRGECEYGVDFSPPSSAFMEMPVGQIFGQANPADPLVFEMFLKPEDITQSQYGMMRVFELAFKGPNVLGNASRGTPLLAVQFGWAKPVRTRTVPVDYFVRGVYSRPHPFVQDATEQEFMDPHIARIPPNTSFNNYFHIVLVWQPASTGSQGETDGWAEIYVNGDLLIQQNGMRLTASGTNAPNVVRYGALDSSDRMGIGTYRITPRYPTPLHPFVQN